MLALRTVRRESETLNGYAARKELYCSAPKRSSSIDDLDSARVAGSSFESQRTSASVTTCGSANVAFDITTTTVSSVAVDDVLRFSVRSS